MSGEAEATGAGAGAQVSKAWGGCWGVGVSGCWGVGVLGCRYVCICI